MVVLMSSINQPGRVARGLAVIVAVGAVGLTAITMTSLGCRDGANATNAPTIQEQQTTHQGAAQNNIKDVVGVEQLD